MTPVRNMHRMFKTLSAGDGCPLCLGYADWLFGDLLERQCVIH